jgi:hypothetical protein
LAGKRFPLTEPAAQDLGLLDIQLPLV